ncbi:hypothetical protein ACWEJ6_49765 [Nonomuraea sp. NPDC004702]
MVEIDRPDRKTRRFQGKPHSIDAIAAAKTALAGIGLARQSSVTVASRRCATRARPGAEPSTSAPTPNASKALIVTAT